MSADTNPEERCKLVIAMFQSALGVLERQGTSSEQRVVFMNGMILLPTLLHRKQRGTQ